MRIPQQLAHLRIGRWDAMRLHNMKYLKSRTVWSAIVIILVNGVPAIQDLIPPNWLPVVNAVLGLLAIYFRVNPRQQF